MRGIRRSSMRHAATCRRPAAITICCGRSRSHLDVWHIVYNHVMAGPEAIVEWFKGSALRPFLDALDGTAREAFLADYTARIAKAYPARYDGKVLLRFPRLFIVAVR